MLPSHVNRLVARAIMFLMVRRWLTSRRITNILPNGRPLTHRPTVALTPPLFLGLGPSTPVLPAEPTMSGL